MRALFKNAGKYDRLTSQYPIERLALSAEWWRLFSDSARTSSIS